MKITAAVFLITFMAFAAPGALVSSAAKQEAQRKMTKIALGVNIFDNCDLETLSEAAAKRKRWELSCRAATP